MDLNQLKELATTYNGYLNGDTALYDDLNELPADVIKSLKKNYEKDANEGRPVNLLRYIILSQLEDGITITPETLDEIKFILEKREIDFFEFLSEDAKRNFLNYPEKTKSFFANWKSAGSILFPFFYTNEIKNQVNQYLDALLHQLIGELDLKDVAKHKVDFLGARKNGSSRIWGAIYPNDKNGHKEAYQLFFNLSHKGLMGGIATGHNIVNGEPEDLEHITSLEGLKKVLKEKVNKWQILNKGIDTQHKPHHQLEDFKVPLNQIFYGPPGTGKTYNTINEAIRIVEELSRQEFDAIYEDRRKLKTVFESYVNKGQIAFTTFHQSMGYEDFVEGIKPETIEVGEGENRLVTVTYPVKDGIFKKLCKNAEGYQTTKRGIEESDESKFEQEDWENAIIYKMALYDHQTYEYCIENKLVALGWGGDHDFTGMKGLDEIKSVYNPSDNPKAARQVYSFISEIKNGNFIIVPDGLDRIKAIGKVVGDYQYSPESEVSFNHTRKVDWLLKDVNLPRIELYERQFTPPTITKLNQDLIKRSFFDQFKVRKQTAAEIVRRNFVLIIDEINRGNVSQIFGELITLLEENKRKGNAEALEITLPYSPDRFGVPNNLYLIGTMNTADRSVETLDTALRRRFMFKEMPPVEDLISPEKAVYDLWETYSEKDYKEYERKEKNLYDFIGLAIDGNRDDKIYSGLEDIPTVSQLEEIFESKGMTFVGVHLKKMLTAINYRIEKLLDKDHTIGHAYFMHIYKAEKPTTALRKTFEKNIIPLLQEYFYGDYGKIGLVLGDAFVKVLKEKNLSFAKFNEINSDLREDYETRAVYTITSAESWQKQDFIAIYE